MLRSVSPARVRDLQAEIAKVWERFTYSGLFKHEYRMQRRPPDELVRSRVGRLSDAIFGQLEPRLRGDDAADALVLHLRMRLLAKAEQQRHSDTNGTTTCPLPQATLLIEHGPTQPLLPA